MESLIDFIFYPKSVAVVGASESPTSWGRFMMEHFKSYGFKGNVYPINPRQSEIMGVKAYSSLDDIPGTVDYVIYIIGIGNALDVLEQCARRGAKTVHLMAGRAAETGRPALIDLEQKILDRARDKMRASLVEAGLPIFPGVGEAAHAVYELITYYRRRAAAD